jgi:hypothetical protein
MNSPYVFWARKLIDVPPKPAYLPAILNDRCREWPLTFERLPRQFPRTDSTPFRVTRRSRHRCCVWIGVKSSGASIVFVFFLFFPLVHLEAFPGYARKKRNQIHSTHPTTRRRATFHMSLEGDGPGVPATGVGAAIPDVSPATPSCLEVPRPGPQIDRLRSVFGPGMPTPMPPQIAPLWGTLEPGRPATLSGFRAARFSGRLDLAPDKILRTRKVPRKLRSYQID